MYTNVSEEEAKADELFFNWPLFSLHFSQSLSSHCVQLGATQRGAAAQFS